MTKRLYEMELRFIGNTPYFYDWIHTPSGRTIRAWKKSQSGKVPIVWRVVFELHKRVELGIIEQSLLSQTRVKPTKGRSYWVNSTSLADAVNELARRAFKPVAD